ncbi:DUF6159 family protein [Methanoregula formicica]|uniref:Uncharacterized protein n=1 Tax=Methanoregula formicica (strain DSM 22288 / NBRC 105244 / SMSP) TaxID=593750 RepID=L0HEU8_METFS|nr:DUF6159 family protein [Methanoregula formicica]AGB01624.1 hypothetical protein Metfor_0561 [Methanoregula formicica SMSP]
MTLVSTLADCWLGLCRRAPRVRASQTVIRDQPEPVHEGQPGGGGGGGTGAVRMGIGAALSGTKTLIRNPQLLWFSLLVALVLAGQSLLHGVIRELSSSPELNFVINSSITEWRFVVDPWITLVCPTFYQNYASTLTSLVFAFVVELPMIFCLVVLLAGLVLSLTSKKGGPVSFFHGLGMARKYLRPLAGWSVVMALAGIIVLFVGYYNSYLLSVSIVQILDHALHQNPFNYVINPNLGNTIFFGGKFDINWLLYSGLWDTLILSAINVLLFVLTLFVVPLIVLEETSLKGAIMGSFTLMRRGWGEVAACLLGLGIVVSAAMFLSLIFPVVAGGNIAVDYWPPPAEWLAAGLLYVLALTSLVVIAATVGGIAALEMYRNAKMRESGQ